MPITNVVVAAGGLGTRVASWARMMPKEFLPIDQAPAFVHLLDEIRGLGEPLCNVYWVYHPYYEPFIDWMKRLLFDGGLERYISLAQELNKDVGPFPALHGLSLQFIRERGPYADLSSIQSCADQLDGAPCYVMFADMLYPGSSPLVQMGQHAEDAPLVLARPYTATDAHRHGVIVASPDHGELRVADIIEKPDPIAAYQLFRRCGPDRLFLLEGRFWLTPDFVKTLTLEACHAGCEPKLSYALRNFARDERVNVAILRGASVDVGATTAATLDTIR